MQPKGIVLAAALCAVLIIAEETDIARASAGPTIRAGQDVINLDRRITSLEQRFYTFESRISSLERIAMMSQRSIPDQTARNPEVELLRSEMELLKSRVRELECGLVHVDERTLPAATREARQRTGQAKDPCRLDPDSPVRLSSRQ
jgi:predicted  nucleic acid-binding Zn-ribbon protein